MFTNKKKETLIGLIDIEVKRLFGELKLLDPKEDREEYDKISKGIQDLLEERKELESKSFRDAVLDPNVLVGGLGFAAVALILNYEKTDIVTSKAFNVATRLLGR